MDSQNNGNSTYRYSYTSYSSGSDNNSYYNGQGEPRGEKKYKKFLKFFGKILAAALIFGLVSGIIFIATIKVGGRITDTEAVSSDTGAVTSGGTIQGTAVSTATAINDVSDIAKNVMPAIVQVTNVSVVEYHGFFGQVFSQPRESAGSGVIIADDGKYIYIATNNHVITNSREVTITFSRNEAVAAEIQGTYPNKDLAVVKVNRSEISEDTLKEIKAATLADSDSVSVGQAVVAIGNALGYGQSVTTGVVSALDREVSIPDETSGNIITNNLLQTDAAINPGNSGGALLNMTGQVIGIVSAKYSDQAVEGMGYAIPINQAKEIIDEIISTGEYTDPGTSTEIPQGEGAYMGIYGGMDIDQNTAQRYGMPTGVYVSQVVTDSPASKAGIERGDIIRAIDGKKVSSITSLQTILAGYKPGDTVTVTVADNKRNYKDVEVSVVLDSKE